MIKKVELLAPAGSWESFIAAVENGADAVYMGGKLFSARHYADNFDDDMLGRALDYAHPRGVKIYLTVNTLLHDDELEQAVKLVEEAYTLGVDGIIVQDMGLASLLRELFPGLSLHASTQSVIYNAEGVEEALREGYERVVLARELSIAEIEGIRSRTTAELEVFVHGALCVCYSGQCLMSSIIGGRSGNRGKCAQPCRQKYSLSSTESPKETTGYLMSTKDIAAVEDLGKLIKAGVTSFKIEGRMKSPEYVATVVKIYRKYLDKALKGAAEPIDKQDFENLAQIFNRGGFSKGYLYGQTGRDMVGPEKPKNWGLPIGEVVSSAPSNETVTVKLTDKISIGDGVEIWNGDEESPGNIITDIRIKGRHTDTAYAGETAELGALRGRVTPGNKVFRTSQKALLKEARQSFEGRAVRQSPIYGLFTASEGVTSALKVWDEEGNTVELTGEKEIEKARNKPTTSERLLEQLYKTGGTPFYFKELKTNIEDGLMLPVSEINELRRKALQDLEKKSVESKRRNLAEKYEEKKESLFNFPGNSRNVSQNKMISAFFYKTEDETVFEDMGADRYYFPFECILNDKKAEKLKKLINEVEDVYLTLPPVVKGNYSKLMENNIDKAVNLGIKGLLLPNISMLNMGFEKKGIKLMGDSFLNVFNSASLKVLQEKGLEGTCLSHELTIDEIRDLKSNPGFIKEVAVYGRLPLMVSEYCPVGSFAGGRTKDKKCNNACQRGEYVLTDKKGARFSVLCNPIDCRSTILNNNVLFLWDTVSDLAKCDVDIFRLMFYDEDEERRAELVALHRQLAQGHRDVAEKYKDLAAEIKNSGFTKGHFHRGV